MRRSFPCFAVSQSLGLFLIVVALGCEGNVGSTFELNVTSNVVPAGSEVRFRVEASGLSGQQTGFEIVDRALGSELVIAVGDRMRDGDFEATWTPVVEAFGVYSVRARLAGTGLESREVQLEVVISEEQSLGLAGGPPTGLFVSDEGGRPKCSWQGGPGDSSWVVFRRVGSVPAPEVAARIAEVRAPSFVDTEADPTQTYFYRVATQRLFPRAGRLFESGPSTEVEWKRPVQAQAGVFPPGAVPVVAAPPPSTTPSPPTSPAPDTTAPLFTGLAAATAASTSQVNLTWLPASDDRTAPSAIVYQVFRGTSPGSTFSSPAYTTSPGATSFSVTGLVAGTTYAFAVRAKDLAGNLDGNTVVKTATTQTLPATGNAALEDQVLTLVNQARAQGATCGTTNYPPVAPLTMNVALRTAARLHSQDMADQNYFSHTSLDGRTFVDRIRAAGYMGSPLGENIAGSASTPQHVVSMWMQSPGHCANIMAAKYRSIGVGLGQNTTSTFKNYWTQDFGGT